MEKIKEIILEVGMSTRPEYYSGRGATTSDLTTNMLFKFYDKILKNFGIDAANNFVKMVANIKVLSATAFLQDLYILTGNGWKYTKPRSHGIAVGKNKDGEYDITNGMAGIMSAVMSNGHDQTEEIRSWFIQRKGTKAMQPKQVFSSYTPDGCCYQYKR
jgi:hypothetical protein